MTRRERLHRCYFHQELDRPGVYVRTNYPANDPTYDRIRALMADRSELKRGWGSLTVQQAPPTEERTEPVDDNWYRWIRIVHTPKGDLRMSVLLSRHDLPGMEEEHLLKDPADAEKYLSLPMPELRGGAEAFFEADRKMGDAGIVDVLLGNNPGGTVADLFGSETFAMMSITDRDILHEICRRQMEITLARLKYVLGHGVGPYFSMLGEEYITPPLHSPADFRDFNLRYDRPILDLVHASGGAIHIHCHGRIGKVIDQFVEMGVDVLHPFEAPPMGDITAAQARAASAGRMCLEGNIQIADVYEKPADDIRRQVRALVRECFADRRNLIISPTASLYQFGKGEQAYANVLAMVEEAQATHS